MNSTNKYANYANQCSTNMRIMQINIELIYGFFVREQHNIWTFQNGTNDQFVRSLMYNNTEFYCLLSELAGSIYVPRKR